MIISSKHEYVFIQLPHTASSSIAKELIQNYDGQKILDKHSAYHEFQKVASAEEKKYFVFSCIRNPLDVVVTRYFKYETNHREEFTNPKAWKKNGGWVPNYQLRRFKYVQENNDFSAYFKKYYKFTYDNWSSLDHKSFDFIIRFENLQNDFAQALKLIGIEALRPLPLVNKTSTKGEDPFSYFMPDVQNQAKEVFSPFMKEWGYDFPDEWGDSSISWMYQLEYELSGIFKKLYWKYWKTTTGSKVPQFFVFKPSRATGWSTAKNSY